MSKVFEAMQEELSKESAMSELWIGKKVELSVNGKIIGVSIDAYYPDRLVYNVEIRDDKNVEIRDDKGISLSTVSVLDHMIIRVMK